MQRDKLTSILISSKKQGSSNTLFYFGQTSVESRKVVPHRFGPSLIKSCPTLP